MVVSGFEGGLSGRWVESEGGLSGGWVEFEGGLSGGGWI